MRAPTQPSTVLGLTIVLLFVSARAVAQAVQCRNRNPDCYAIQHFGCSLAMYLGSRQEVGEACRRAINLAGTQ
jgi:hypothetical protein